MQFGAEYSSVFYLVDSLYLNQSDWFITHVLSLKKVFFKTKICLSKILPFELNFGNLNIRQRFRTFREEWPNRTPKQKWQFLCDIPGVLLRIFGIRILQDCRVYWLSYFGSFLALNYFGLATYTLVYYAKQGRFIHGTICLCGAGIVCTVCLST